MSATDTPATPAAKAFASARAQAALAGVVLLRTHPDDGPPRLIAERQGVLRQVHSLDDLEALLAQEAAP